MKYQQTFRLPVEDVLRHGEDILDYSKNIYSGNIGNLICKQIGFKEVESETPDFKKYEIEVCAFDWNDWVEFKQKISSMFFNGLLVLGKPEIKKLFEDFESKYLPEELAEPVKIKS